MDWFKIRSWLGAKLLISFQSCNSFGQIGEINTHTRKRQRPLPGTDSCTQIPAHPTPRTTGTSLTNLPVGIFTAVFPQNLPENFWLAFRAIAPWASTAARSCAVQEITRDPLQGLGVGKQPPITFMSAFLRSLFKHMSTSRSQTALLWMVCSPSQAWVWARKHYPLTVKADFCFIAFAVIPHSWMLWEAVPLLGILCCVYFH